MPFLLATTGPTQSISALYLSRESHSSFYICFVNHDSKVNEKPVDRIHNFKAMDDRKGWAHEKNDNFERLSPNLFKQESTDSTEDGRNHCNPTLSIVFTETGHVWCMKNIGICIEEICT